MSMEIKYFIQNVTLTGEIKEFLHEKIQKFSRFSNKIWEARVDLSYNPGHSKDQVFRLEINLRLPDKILRGVARAPDLQTAVNTVEKKLKRQMEKYKGAWEARNRRTKKAVRHKKTG